MEKIQLFYDSISLRGSKGPPSVFEGFGGDFGVELLAEVAYIYCISSNFDLYAGFDCGVDVDFDGGFDFRRGVTGAASPCRGGSARQIGAIRPLFGWSEGETSPLKRF